MCNLRINFKTNSYLALFVLCSSVFFPANYNFFHAQESINFSCKLYIFFLCTSDFNFHVNFSFVYSSEIYFLVNYIYPCSRGFYRSSDLYFLANYNYLSMPKRLLLSCILYFSLLERPLHSC